MGQFIARPHRFHPRSMLCRNTSWFLWAVVTFLAATDHNEADSTAESDPDFTIYRLRTDHPWEMFRDDQAGAVAENLEELIMAHDYEREFIMPKSRLNFEEHIDASPYYVVTQQDPCKADNGNCSQKCEHVGHQAVCSCREGYTLTGPGVCSPISGCDIVLSGTSGKFTVNKSPCQWTIKAPNHHIIEVKLQALRSWFSSDPDDSLANIYDGDSTAARVLKRVSVIQGATVLRSSGQNLLIRSLQGWSPHGTRLQVSYVTGSQYFQIVDGKAVGHLMIPTSSLSENQLCLSVTYSKPQNSNLTISLNQEIDTPEFSFKHPDGKWRRVIYRHQINGENTQIKLSFYGRDAKVYNLGRCLNFEYHAIGGQKSIGPETMCQNGGMWSNATQSCLCPPGFTGIDCEEGCGPNTYGANCSKICSNLSSVCAGMLFCTKEMCSCAAGLQGLKCDSPCDAGYYGSSCKQHCGECKDGEPCDQHTGSCYSGCSAGLYPPFCRNTYKVLLNAPEVVAATYNSLKIRMSFENVIGEGEPVSYEVQYKEEKQGLWSKLSPRIISNETEFEIMGLLPGKVYEARVILIDKDGGSYQTDVPKNTARTRCKDPHEADYNFAVTDVYETSIHVGWSYIPDETSLSCEIVDFELSVLCGDDHFKFPITEKEGSKLLTEMIPDTNYSLQLTGKTATGKRTPAVEITVRTQPAAPGRVRNVKAVPSISGRQLNVTWQPPWNSEGKSLQYRVMYQCLHLLACEGVGCPASSGGVDMSSTAVVLDQLQPHAFYQIAVAALSEGGLVSQSFMVNAVTAQAAPHAPPSAAESPILAVTNTSALLTWKPPEDCSTLNAYIYGYSYELVENDTEEILQQGTVPENVRSVNFSGLAPNRCYDAHIAVVSSGGTSLSNLLIIPFCTSSTAPDQVQSLSVYKRGRRMVGLRWSLPLNTYGDIEYFSITYNTEGSNHSSKVTTEAKHCGAWVDLYCYTVSSLSPGKKYRFQVQARNTEVSIDGEPTAVEAITLEGASSPPVKLSIMNATESSILLQWGMPDNVNGQLRSFIIVVEQIDTQANSYECCDDIPLQDYRVTSEEPFYQYEVTGLSAASTYSVTVSSKTVTLGEESRITGHTYPPKSSLPRNALTVAKTGNSSNESDVVVLQMQPAERINGVNRTYILLYLTNSSSTQQSSDDHGLRSLLQSRFTENYYVISEFTQEEVEMQPVVTFNLNDLGLQSTQTQSKKYALALIQDYMGNRNMDIFLTGLP